MTTPGSLARVHVRACELRRREELRAAEGGRADPMGSLAGLFEQTLVGLLVLFHAFRKGFDGSLRFFGDGSSVRRFGWFRGLYALASALALWIGRARLRLLFRRRTTW